MRQTLLWPWRCKGVNGVAETRLSVSCPIRIPFSYLQGLTEPPASCKLLKTRTNVRLIQRSVVQIPPQPTNSHTVEQLLLKSASHQDGNVARLWRNCSSPQDPPAFLAVMQVTFCCMSLRQCEQTPIEECLASVDDDEEVLERWGHTGSRTMRKSGSTQWRSILHAWCRSLCHGGAGEKRT